MIIFGETGFGLCPGIHKVKDYSDICEAIEVCRTERSEGIKQEDIRAYLAAFVENSIFSMVYADEGLSREDPGFELSKNALVDVICRRIES